MKTLDFGFFDFDTIQDYLEELAFKAMAGKWIIYIQNDIFSPRCTEVRELVLGQLNESIAL